MRKITLALIGLFSTVGIAQDRPDLAAAKALDHAITRLSDLPATDRPAAIRDLAARVRAQPARYAIALAYNLAISAIEDSGPDTLQDVANTLAGAIRQSPPELRDESGYLLLAKLARYYSARVSLDDPGYTAAAAKLQADDLARSESDFTLVDADGKKWNLRSLRNRVVLVTFWATWCPPCRREVPDLNLLHQRFKDRGLVILAITGEEAPAVRPFLAAEKVTYPVLLDPGDKVRELFRVEGVPETFVFDRDGRLAAGAMDRPGMSGFIGMLAKAGLQSAN